MQIACKCGGTFRSIEGLEGMQCDKCGKIVSGATDMLNPNPGDSCKLETCYSEERLKPLRGVSMSSLVIGTPSKGCLTVVYPPNLSASEQKALIDSELGLLKYAKDKVKELGLDIYSSKARKEVNE